MPAQGDANVRNPVVYFEIVGKGAPALRDFYGGVFGWTVAERIAGAGIADYTRVDTGFGIEGGIGEAPPGYDGHATFYVAVGDVAATLDEVGKRGGTVMFGPREVGDRITIGLFRDPGGHVVGVIHNPAVPPPPSDR